MPAEAVVPMDDSSRVEQMLARAGARDRANIEKHLAACDAESDVNHGKIWRRIAARLGDMAPMPVRMSGSHAVLFFIADGKYRMQVFALEDHRDGTIQLYLPDVLEEALQKKLIVRTDDGFETPKSPKVPVHLSLVENSGPTDPSPHVKQMLGWKRKALKLSITAFDYEGPIIDLADKFVSLAASKFEKPVEK